MRLCSERGKRGREYSKPGIGRRAHSNNWFVELGVNSSLFFPILVAAMAVALISISFDSFEKRQKLRRRASDVEQLLTAMRFSPVGPDGYDRVGLSAERINGVAPALQAQVADEIPAMELNGDSALAEPIQATVQWGNAMLQKALTNVFSGRHHGLDVVFYEFARLTDGDKVQGLPIASGCLVHLPRPVESFSVARRPLRSRVTPVESGNPDFDEEFSANGDAVFVRRFATPAVIDELDWGDGLIKHVTGDSELLHCRTKPIVPDTLLLSFLDNATAIAKDVMRAAEDGASSDSNPGREG